MEIPGRGGPWRGVVDGWVQVEGKIAGLTGEADEGTERPSESNSATVLVLCARI